MDGTERVVAERLPSTTARLARIGMTALVCALCVACASTRPTPPTPDRDVDVEAMNRQLALVAAATDEPGDPEYRIGSEDLLEVTLFDIVSKSGSPRVIPVRVSAAGTITMPLVGTVEVGGMTPAEAERALSERFHRYIHQPQITVFVKEHRSYRVSVVGYVEEPGIYDVTGSKTLLEALAMAGGLTEKAGNTVQVSRRTDDKIQTFFVDLDKLAEGGDIRLNLTLLPGDVVNVPKAGLVYVQGSVKKPGSYRLRRGMTVAQALGAAGGPDEKLAKSAAVQLYRRTPQGSRQEIPVDIERIATGEEEDVLLVENDIIVVPMSMPKFLVDRFIGGVGMGISVPIF